MSFEKPKFIDEPGPDSMPEKVPSREELNKFEEGPEPLEPDTIPEEKEFFEEEKKERKNKKRGGFKKRLFLIGTKNKPRA